MTVLQMFATAAEAAAKLSVLLATPAGGLLALPAAWNFVQQVLAGVAKFQESSQ